jgi:hypothetical protein
VLHYELAPSGADITVLPPGSVETAVIDALGLRRAALPIRPQPAKELLADVHAEGGAAWACCRADHALSYDRAVGDARLAGYPRADPPI